MITAPTEQVVQQRIERAGVESRAAVMRAIQAIGSGPPMLPSVDEEDRRRTEGLKNAAAQRVAEYQRRQGGA